MTIDTNFLQEICTKEFKLKSYDKINNYQIHDDYIEVFYNKCGSDDIIEFSELLTKKSYLSYLRNKKINSLIEK